MSIPEISQDAPFTSEQRKWLETYLDDFRKSIISSIQKGKPSNNSPRAILMFGSQGGNCQALAEGYADKLEEKGWSSEVVDMEDFKSFDLTKEPLILIITSTWGEGDPPDNATEFWNSLKSDDFSSLQNSRFSVLSLGDTSYTDFCKMGKLFDSRMEELSANRIVDRVDCDVDYEEDADKWFDNVLLKLEEIGNEPFIVDSPNKEDLSSKEVDLSNIPYGKKRPFLSSLKERYRLNKEGSSGDTHHIVLSLKDSGMKYEVGDALSVTPHNNEDLVNEILDILPFNTSVSVKTFKGNKTSLKEALIKYYDIRSVTKSMIKKWAKFSFHPYLLASLDSDKELSEILEGIEVIDLIYDFPADFKNAQEFIDLLNRLQPRLYSISSSYNKNPQEVHITVANVSYKSKGRIRKGACSNFLCYNLVENDKAEVFIQSANHFKLPEDNKDIIMIGPGTGIAPFIAFLQEREFKNSNGKNWLFFGNPNESTDYFYESQIKDWKESNLLTKINCAWSRDQDYKVYVQDKIIDNSKEVWEWIQAGAHIYICGDASKMAKDVESALIKIISEEGKLNKEDSEKFLLSLKENHRYQKDVY